MKRKPAVDVIEEEDAGATLAVDGGWKPDFTVDLGRTEVKGESFVDVEDEACTDLEIVQEVAFATDEDTILFVDPDGSDEIADDSFEGVAGFDVGIAGVVDDDGGAAVEVDAAGVGEGAEFEDTGGGEDDVAA